MPTYGMMQARIADELSRTDLTGQVQNAIQDSILHYQRRRFPWNEVEFTFPTVNGQEYYGATANANIPTLVEIDSIKAQLAGSTSSKLVLLNKPFQWIDLQAANTTTSSYPPVAYTYYNLLLRIYPIPNQVQTITVDGVIRLAPLVNNIDTNAWTTDGEELIRTYAKIKLLRTIMADTDTTRGETQELLANLAEIETGLMAENFQRISSRINQAYYL